MYDSTKTVQEFLSATAARQPTPGGGSVSALVGALSAALGEMVVNYSIGKKGLEAYQNELKPAAAELVRARAMLQQLMVEDQAAYQAMSAARKLPADSAERRQQLPAAMQACVRVPQAIAGAGVAVLDLFDRIVSFVNPYLLSDLAVAADLAMATIRCAIYSVRANLRDLSEERDREAVQAEIGKLLGRALALIQSVTPRVWQRYEQSA